MQFILICHHKSNHDYIWSMMAVAAAWDDCDGFSYKLKEYSYPFVPNSGVLNVSQPDEKGKTSAKH